MAVGNQRPPSRLGRSVEMLVDERSEAGDLQVPVLLQDVAWTDPGAYEQAPPHKKVVKDAVAPNLFIADLNEEAHLCTAAQIDVFSHGVIASSQSDGAVTARRRPRESPYG